MSDLITRIKILERKIIPESAKEVSEGCLTMWEENNKIYFKDNNGNEKEFIESEHKRNGVIGIIFPKDLALLSWRGSPITNL